MYELFPRLQERLTNWGNQLSGGEQQMLAIGRALLLNPSLMMLDEADGRASATGAAGNLVLPRIGFGNDGIAILVVDKNIRRSCRSPAALHHPEG